MNALKQTVELKPGERLQVDIPNDIEAGTYELTLVLRPRVPEAETVDVESTPKLYAGVFTTPPHDVPLSDPGYLFTRDQIYEDEDDVDLR